MYARFVNDLNMNDFFVPSLFRGFGLAILYISIGLYTTAKLPIPSTLKAVGLILFVRQLFGAGIISGLYNYLLYADTNRHLSGLASQVDSNEPMLSQRANFTEYYKYILQQANLSALKEISGSIIIFGLTVIIILIVVMAYRKIRKGFFAAA